MPYVVNSPDMDTIAADHLDAQDDLTKPVDRPRPDLSPSAVQSLRGLLRGRGATWRESLDGSAVGALAALVSALVLLRLIRRRRT